MTYVKPWRLATSAALACSLALPCLAQEKVQFPSLDRWQGSERLVLDAYLYKPEAQGRFVALVMFHGCAGALGKNGLITQRFRDTAKLLNGMGYGVLLVDSFNPRGERQICTVNPKARAIQEEHRWLDAYGVIEYLNTRADVVPGKIGAIGFSHGGTAAVQVMNAELPVKKQGAPGFAAAIAMYPGCASTLAARPDYVAYAPLLILAGELDDWTPARYCQKLAERSKGRGQPVDIEIYPDAYHGFDELSPVKLREDVVRSGKPVHVGGNPAARVAAHARIREFFARHLPAQ
ncbi:dienelactone hydrolase-like enzyme [Polaromonas sp. CF318]|uniref:dienelactone hydrolase family protein n=1 Tax=Polaromonas sp. CF318 TaxID=1144318 RepID=UPI000270EAB2|nr:dienelactone hydrolase family protein [Polaromonas sp. CF318]EJL83671.1 dienelactone hydrolase-like enzyme [Polaromonas sp. CF318]